MQTVTGPVWLLAVLGMLAVVGFVAVCWTAAGVAERAADWWHDQRSPNPDYDGDGWDYPDDGPGDDDLDGPPPLPPERTWEQMTSNQLPLTEIAEQNPRWVAAGRPMLTAERERRAPWWEAEHRAAYVAMGFDYPSGLMARVRELAP